MPEETFLQFFSDHIRRGGVVDVEGGASLVSEKSGTPDMSVDVAIGQGWLRKSDTSVYPYRTNSSENVSISNNASGNPRIDTVVVYADLAQSPNTDASNVILYASVDGTPASSPTAPSDSDIETAIGANNPYERLATVAVDSGETEILDADITDVRRWPFLKQDTPINTIDYAASITVNMEESNFHEVTLTGNIIVSSFSNMQPGEWSSVKFIQDGSGGHTVTFTPTTNTKSPDISLANGANEETIYLLHKQADGSLDLYLGGKDY